MEDESYSREHGSQINANMNTFSSNGGQVEIHNSEAERTFIRKAYLFKDFSTKEQVLQERRRETLKDIEVAVCCIFYDTNADPRSMALIYQSLSEYSQFFDICKLIYRASSKDEIQREVERQPTLSKRQFVLAMIGAAAHDWVLVGHRCSLSEQLLRKGRVSTMFEESILGREFLSEWLLVGPAAKVYTVF